MCNAIENSHQPVNVMEYEPGYKTVKTILLSSTLQATQYEFKMEKSEIHRSPSPRMSNDTNNKNNRKSGDDVNLEERDKKIN